MQSNGEIDRLAERERQRFTGELDRAPDGADDAPERQTDEQIEARANDVRRWMWRELSTDASGRSSFYFDVDGTVLSTKLAEAAAQALNLYYDDVEYVIPDVVFDWAVEVDEEWALQSEGR